MRPVGSVREEAAGVWLLGAAVGIVGEGVRLVEGRNHWRSRKDRCFQVGRGTD